LDGLRTKPPCHRSDLIYRLCQPGLTDQPGLIDQGLPGSRWIARPAWPPFSDASASRRMACGDRFLHRQSTSPSLERHRIQRERLLQPLRTSACSTSTPPPVPLPDLACGAAGIEIQVPANRREAAGLPLAAAHGASGRFPAPGLLRQRQPPLVRSLSGTSIGDKRIIRLIRKWLEAGILQHGVATVADSGTGQGSVISPLLGNIYLRYVFDLWAERWRRQGARGDAVR
jgi:hypothetical protein